METKRLFEILGLRASDMGSDVMAAHQVALHVTKTGIFENHPDRGHHNAKLLADFTAARNAIRNLSEFQTHFIAAKDSHTLNLEDTKFSPQSPTDTAPARTQTTETDYGPLREKLRQRMMAAEKEQPPMSTAIAIEPKTTPAPRTNVGPSKTAQPVHQTPAGTKIPQHGYDEAREDLSHTGPTHMDFKL